VASYPAWEQIPWLRERYSAALAVWEQNPTDTVRRLEMGMIAVVDAQPEDPTKMLGCRQGDALAEPGRP
jgi:hypothetical protein